MMDSSVTDQRARDAISLNKLSTSTELVKSELLTSDELVKSELVKSEEPVKGGEFVTSGVYTNRFGFETNVVEVNGIGDTEDVSRSVRWNIGEQKPQEVNGISEDQMTGPAALRFNISSVQRPLAAASKVASSGNRITLEGRGDLLNQWRLGSASP